VQAREEIARVRRIAGKVDRDAHGGGTLLESLALAPFAGDDDLQRQQAARKHRQRIDQHIIALDRMKPAEAADPHGLARLPAPGHRSGGVGAEDRPLDEPAGRHLEPFGGELRHRVGIPHPEVGERLEQAQQSAIGGLEVGGMLPADHRYATTQPDHLPEQRRAGERGPDVRRPILSHALVEPAQRSEMILLAAIAHDDLQPGRLHLRDRATVPACQRIDANLRTAAAQNLRDRRHRQGRSTAFDGVDDIGDPHHATSRRLASTDRKLST
jgi:hypothetical protein